MASEGSLPYQYTQLPAQTNLHATPQPDMNNLEGLITITAEWEEDRWLFRPKRRKHTETWYVEADTNTYDIVANLLPESPRRSNGMRLKDGKVDALQHYFTVHTEPVLGGSVSGVKVIRWSEANLVPWNETKRVPGIMTRTQEIELERKHDNTHLALGLLQTIVNCTDGTRFSRVLFPCYKQYKRLESKFTFILRSPVNVILKKMHHQKTTAELLACAIKVCNEACDYANTYHSCGDCVDDTVGLARSCKEVLELFQSVIECNNKDDPVYANIESIVAKSEDDIRELKKRLKEIKYSNQKWLGGKLFAMFCRKGQNLKPNLQSLRDNLGSAKKVTTITVKKCEQHTVKTVLHDETDDVIESPPPRYTRYEKKPSTMYSAKSTRTELLDRDFVPEPGHGSLQNTVNGTTFRQHREVDLQDEEYNTMTGPWDMGCRPPFYEDRFSRRPPGVCIAINYRNRAAPRAPLFVVIPQGVRVGLRLSPY
ncbi:hypothetical protein PISL3812_00129 [Talaromyces islandicus]|uniref:Uncharacterized protein n=1 Tax=Talaromyces islandicus TaxID=28573 RepID=A0A0U1LIE0_TALIS|nr:hypothetical protein PISL3812_00129 [Talaromyces islandicus]